MPLYQFGRFLFVRCSVCYFMFNRLHVDLRSFYIVPGNLLRFCTQVRRIHAAGNLLYQSINMSIKRHVCPYLIGPMKSKWTSLFVCFCLWIVIILNHWVLFSTVTGHLAAVNSSLFVCISFVSFGHQNSFADAVLLLISGWPLCNSVITVRRKA